MSHEGQLSRDAPGGGSKRGARAVAAGGHAARRERQRRNPSSRRRARCPSARAAAGGGSRCRRAIFGCVVVGGCRFGWLAPAHDCRRGSESTVDERVAASPLVSMATLGAGSRRCRLGSRSASLRAVDVRMAMMRMGTRTCGCESPSWTRAPTSLPAASATPTTRDHGATRTPRHQGILVSSAVLGPPQQPYPAGGQRRVCATKPRHPVSFTFVTSAIFSSFPTRSSNSRRGPAVLTRRVVALWR